MCESERKSWWAAWSASASASPVSDPRVEPTSGAKKRQKVAARTHMMASRDEGGHRGFESTDLGVESTAVSVWMHVSK